MTDALGSVSALVPVTRGGFTTKLWVCADWASSFVKGEPCDNSRFGVLLVADTVTMAQGEIFKNHIVGDSNDPSIRAGIMATLSPELPIEETAPATAKTVPITEVISRNNKSILRKNRRIITPSSISSSTGSQISPSGDTPGQQQTAALITIRDAPSGAEYIFEMDVNINEGSAIRAALLSVPFTQLDWPTGVARLFSAQMRSQAIYKNLILSTTKAVDEAAEKTVTLRNEFLAALSEKKNQEDRLIEAMAKILNEKKKQLRALKRQLGLDDKAQKVEEATPYKRQKQEETNVRDIDNKSEMAEQSEKSKSESDQDSLDDLLFS